MKKQPVPLLYTGEAYPSFCFVLIFSTLAHIPNIQAAFQNLESPFEVTKGLLVTGEAILSGKKVSVPELASTRLATLLGYPDAYALSKVLMDLHVKGETLKIAEMRLDDPALENELGKLDPSSAAGAAKLSSIKKQLAEAKAAALVADSNNSKKKNPMLNPIIANTSLAGIPASAEEQIVTCKPGSICAAKKEAALKIMANANLDNIISSSWGRDSSYVSNSDGTNRGARNSVGTSPGATTGTLASTLASHGTYNRKKAAQGNFMVPMSPSVVSTTPPLEPSVIETIQNKATPYKTPSAALVAEYVQQGKDLKPLLPPGWSYHIDKESGIVVWGPDPDKPVNTANKDDPANKLQVAFTKGKRDEAPKVVTIDKCGVCYGGFYEDYAKEVKASKPGMPPSLLEVLSSKDDPEIFAKSDILEGQLEKSVQIEGLKQTEPGIKEQGPKGGLSSLLVENTNLKTDKSATDF